MSRTLTAVLGSLVALGALAALTVWQLGAPAAPLAPVTMGTHQLSLAVLPIVDLSGDAGDDSRAAQLDAGLRTALSRLAGLTMRLASADARYVLDGSVRRVDGRPRFVATLVDTMTGHAVGPGPFDRPLTSVAFVQSELLRWIGAALSVTVTTADEAPAVAPAPPTSASAPAVTTAPLVRPRVEAARPSRAKVAPPLPPPAPTEPVREAPAAIPRVVAPVAPAATVRDDSPPPPLSRPAPRAAPRPAWNPFDREATPHQSP